ncbi:hypothetical protein [Legionella sp. km772]|uniref:hypothetical protein n=1 Tax=Legionella sp. km772 TaxID=2498111 RepID=UPI000F8D24B9|nr:hypothetical protein [Legionella sp. km772]RUR08807.1 hypothetical protein ELY15_10110 [Legionella sp. km772]
MLKKSLFVSLGILSTMGNAGTCPATQVPISQCPQLSPSAAYCASYYYPDGKDFHVCSFNPTSNKCVDSSTTCTPAS